MPYIVIGLTHNVTLGHVILLGAMFEAGVVIGGLTGSLGWIAASLVWAASGMFILYHPQGQDYTLGFALAVGFILVGLLRRCFCDEEPPNVSEAVGAGGASRAGEGPREASSGRS
ncbi:MAG: hypothetical protein NTW87_05455 [Planctomycetota bacterium]|nr:hypothetical protein [Planctomycetota bacterium]